MRGPHEGAKEQEGADFKGIVKEGVYSNLEPPRKHGLSDVSPLAAHSACFLLFGLMNYVPVTPKA